MRECICLQRVLGDIADLGDSLASRSAEAERMARDARLALRRFAALDFFGRQESIVADLLPHLERFVSAARTAADHQEGRTP